MKAKLGKIIHVTTTIQKDGTIILDNLPLSAGDKVEVVIYESTSSMYFSPPLPNPIPPRRLLAGRDDLADR